MLAEVAVASEVPAGSRLAMSASACVQPTLSLISRSCTCYSFLPACIPCRISKLMRNKWVNILACFAARLDQMAAHLLPPPAGVQG